MHHIGNDIFGSRYYFNDDKPGLVFGKFNSVIEDKVIVVLNETSGQDTYAINENIKNAITKLINTIEHKGMTPYDNKNHVAYIFLSNNDTPIKVPQNDRRFMGFECNNSICNNFDYFKALREEIDSGIYIRAFYDYLMGLDVKNYDFTNNRPKTKFYNDMQEQNIPLIATFLNEKYILPHEVKIKKHPEYKEEIKANEFFEKFNNYLIGGNFKFESNLTSFGRQIKAFPSIVKFKKSSYYYSINIMNLKKELLTKYPSFNNVEEKDPKNVKAENAIITEAEDTNDNNEEVSDNDEDDEEKENVNLKPIATRKKEKGKNLIEEDDSDADETYGEIDISKKR
jgi:hypothetical protein